MKQVACCGTAVIEAAKPRRAPFISAACISAAFTLTAFTLVPGAEAQQTPPTGSLCDLPAYRNTPAYQKYCGGGGPTYPIYVDPHIQRLQRYQAVLAQVRDLVGNLQAYAATDGELSGLAGDLDATLFDVAASARQKAANAQARLSVLSPALEALENRSSAIYTNYVERLEPAAQQARAAAAQAARRLAAAQNIAKQIDSASQYFQGLAHATKSDVEYWLNVVLLPSDTLDALRPMYMPIPLRGEPIRPAYVEPPHAMPSPALAIPAAPQATQSFTKAVQPPLAASLDERIATAEQLAAEARAALQNASATAAQLADKLDRYREYTGIVNDYLGRSGTAQAEIDAAQRTQKRDEWQREGIENHITASATAMFSDAAEQYAWSNFKNQVVIPELKRIVSAAYAGQMTYTLDDSFVQDAWNKHTLHLFALAGKGETASAAGELLRKKQTLLNGGEQGATEAASLLALGTPAEARDYADTLFKRLDGDALEEAHQALKVAAVPEPYRTFWLKYFVN